MREECSSGGVNPCRAACKEGSWGFRPSLIQTGGQGGWGGGGGQQQMLLFDLGQAAGISFCMEGSAQSWTANLLLQMDVL